MLTKKSKDKNSLKSLLSSRQLHGVIATALLLICLLGISAAFVLRVYISTESSCYEQLVSETEGAVNALESNLRSDRMTLRVIAGLIGSASDIDSLEVGGYLSNYDVNSLITQIGILLPEDELMSSKSRRGIQHGELSFEEESHRGEHISSLQPSGANPNAMVIRNYVPVRQDGLCIGMLYSAASPSNIAKAWLPDLYGKQSRCYVVDRKTGEVIINSTSDELSVINELSFIQTNATYTKVDAVCNILDGKKGYSVFKTDRLSENHYMCYLPFSIEDWEIVVIVPESAVFSEVTPVRKSIYTLIVAVVTIIIAYVLWLVRELRSSIMETEQKANTDVLTGLQNRNRYEMFLNKLGGSCKGLACIYIDANGLHELNNSKGHFAGDQMLRFIADTLKVQFSGENIFRIGGDEFVVFQSGKKADEVNKALSNFVEALSRNDYHAAVGTSFFEEGMSADELIGSAEKKMYEAKKQYYESIGKTMRV